jgi:hypothetical protein
MYKINLLGGASHSTIEFDKSCEHRWKLMIPQEKELFKSLGSWRGHWDEQDEKSCAVGDKAALLTELGLGRRPADVYSNILRS